jgi:uroporphyrinogen-III synthase
MAVVVTKSKEDNQDLIKLLEQEGLECLSLPCIEFREPQEGFKKLDEALRKNHEYDWIFFLSKRSAKVFFERLLAIGGHLFHLAPNLKLACIGESTKNYIEKEIGFPVDFYPAHYNSECFIEEFTDKYTEAQSAAFPRLKVILPRTDAVDDEFSENLQLKAYNKLAANRGNKCFKNISDIPETISNEIIYINRVAAYESFCPNIDELYDALDKLKQFSENGEILLTFTSSETVRNFKKLSQSVFDFNALTVKSSLKIFSIGPKTSQSLQNEYPILLEYPNILIEAEKSSLQGLLSVIRSSLSNENRLKN